MCYNTYTMRQSKKQKNLDDKFSSCEQILKTQYDMSIIFEHCTEPG